MPFELTGMQELINSGGIPPVIEDRVFRLERAVEDCSNDSFGHSKSLVESVCKTILIDKGIQVDSDWKLPKLMSEVMTYLPLVSSSHPLSSDARERLKTLQRGLQGTVTGLAQMRNLVDWASHGPDGFMEPMDDVHIRLSAMSADAISCFLLSMHQKFSYPDDRARIYYEDYPEFNNWVDENNEVYVFEQEILPSKVLFFSDEEHSAYREKYKLYQIDKEMGLIDE